MSDKDLNSNLQEPTNIISELVGKINNIELKLADKEKQAMNIETDFAEMNDRLINASNDIRSIKSHIANQIVQSIGEKPEVRWWHRLGDEMGEKYKSLNLLNRVGILLIYFGICLFFIWFGETFQNKIALFFVSIFIFLPSILVTIVINKSAIKILKKDYHLIIKNFLVKNIWLLTQFLVIIFVIDITLFNINKSIFSVLLFFYHNHIIAKLFVLIREYLISFDPLFKESMVYLVYFVAPLYSIIFSRILVALNKATLQSFSNKWKNYKYTLLPVIAINYLISVGAILHVCIQDQVFRNPADQQKAMKFYDEICNDFAWYFIMIYVLSFIDLIIANYKIDKKRIAIWQEKSKQLQQFTDSPGKY